MKILIASDIFGKTPELEDLVAQLSANAINTVIVDPYEGKYLNFKNEDEAYSYFRQKVGIERYKEMVYEATSDIKRDLLLIGFSVGASAIWAISDKFGARTNARAICFYGSQIRNFMDVNPAICMELIFPKQEPHFNVGNLIAQISLKKNVTCKTALYLHGFMNKRSANFNKSAFESYLSIINEKLAYHFASPDSGHSAASNGQQSVKLQGRMK